MKADFISNIHLDFWLAKLINDVLDLTRLESGAVELNKIRINYNTVIERVIEKLNEEIKKKELILTKGFAEE